MGATVARLDAARPGGEGPRPLSLALSPVPVPVMSLAVGTFAPGPGARALPTVGFPPGLECVMTDDKNVRGRIVVGVDGSDHSVMALRWAVQQAERTGADVEVLGCWQWPVSTGGFLPYESVDMSGTTRKAVDAAVASVVRDGDRSAVAVRTTVVEGYPAKALLARRREQSCWSSAPGGTTPSAALLLGSVGMHCATHAPCPVLTVHEPVRHVH